MISVDMIRHDPDSKAIIIILTSERPCDDITLRKIMIGVQKASKTFCILV
jgi:hypothetical protein